MQHPSYIHSGWFEPRFSQIIEEFRIKKNRPPLGIQLPDMKLADYIRILVKNDTRTVSEIAETAGMSYDMLRDITREKRVLRHKEVRGLARTLKVSEELLHKMIDRELAG